MRTYLIAFKSGRFETLQCEWASMRDQFAAFALNGYPFYWIDRDILNAIREITGYDQGQIAMIKRSLVQPNRSAMATPPPEPEMAADQVGRIPDALLISDAEESDHGSS